MEKLLSNFWMESVLVVAVWLLCPHQRIMMPTYEFKCNQCATLIETNTRDLPTCNLCGEIMIRLYSSTPVHFKGTGFYKTGG